jgi:hypothetical protein
MIDPGALGPPNDDPRSIRLNELRTKSKDGRKSKNGLTPEEVKEYRSLVHELVAEQVEQAKAAPRPALMVADANSFRAMPLRKRAKEAAVDENDPLLLWALEAQEKADWRTSPEWWLEMHSAVWAFLEAHFEIKHAWPPNSEKIEILLQKLEYGKATAIEIKEFRRLADEVLRQWDSEAWSPKFRERIESAKSLLGTAKSLPDPAAGKESKGNSPAGGFYMLPYVPGSETWLTSAKTYLGLSEDHPKVARILEILRKKESGEITVQEHKEFFLLNDQLTSAHEFLYGKKIYPSGEVDSYPEIPTREQIAGAVDWMFDRDEDEARAYSERLAVLDRQVRAQGIALCGGGLGRTVQLAEAVGLDENHPALRKRLEDVDLKLGKITWKEHLAELNALVDAMEEAWKKKNGH